MALKSLKLASIVTASLIASAVIGYVGTGIFYENHFYPKSKVNGQDVSNKSIDDAVSVMSNAADSYELDVITRTGVHYKIDGDDIAYEFIKNGSVDDFLKKQEAFNWINEIGKNHEYSITTTTTFDEDKLLEKANKLPCFDKEKQIKPTDATIEMVGDSIQVMKESQGDYLRKDVAVDKIVNAVRNGDSSIIFDDECYVKPQITTTSEKITNAMAKIEKSFSTQINLMFGDDSLVITPEEIKSWITIDDEYNVVVNEEKAAQYAQKAASQFNTFGSKRKFKTHSKKIVEIGGGDYGWIVDKPSEAKQLIEDVKTGGYIERNPVFAQTAKVLGHDDIGDTYVEIDYTKQHMYYYKDGKCVLHCDVVTGNLSQNNGSPDGLFKIGYKQSPATLVGEGYSSPVEYFMVFAYNVGFHDASWRNEFGDEIYKTKGSHGCINMPLDKAKKLYEMIEVGTPIIAYYSESVTLTAENAKISNAYSYRETTEDKK